jgi:ankyrin repeat protein
VNALQAQWTLGADVNQRNAQGRTALMSAAARGHTEAVRALLQAGANPRLRDGQGNTALDLAGAPSQQQVPALLDLLRAAQAAP